MTRPGRKILLLMQAMAEWDIGVVVIAELYTVLDRPD